MKRKRSTSAFLDFDSVARMTTGRVYGMSYSDASALHEFGAWLRGAMVNRFVVVPGLRFNRAGVPYFLK